VTVDAWFCTAVRARLWLSGRGFEFGST